MLFDSSRSIWSNWRIGLSTPENVSKSVVNLGELSPELRAVGDISSPGAGDRGSCGGLSEVEDCGAERDS